jgi:hypothetical protein
MKLSIFYFLFSIFFLVLLPLVASAHAPQLWGMPPGYWGPILSCSGSGQGGLPKCTSLCDLLHTFQNVIYFGISLAFFAIAPVLLIWGGVLILIAGANPGLLEQGKKILTGTLIGILIVLCAFLIVNTFLWFLAKSGGGQGTVPTGVGWPNIQCNPAGLPGTLQK